MLRIRLSDGRPLGERMVQACFFDLYNTLVYFHPSREERQAIAARQFGIEIDPAALHKAYVAGEHFWTIENGREAIQKRSEEERARFYTEYEKRLLAAAGIAVADDTALKIYRAYRQTKAGLRLFDDVLPTLATLHHRGVALGLISNWDQAVTTFCQELGIGQYLDFILSSHEVGVEKPDVRIFEEALRRAAVRPVEAMHVGDQYHSDVVGARRAGIRPVLLDRFGFLSEFTDCVRIRSLAEVPDLIESPIEPSS